LTSGERFWLRELGFIALDTSLPHLCITLDFMADNAHEHAARLCRTLCWWLLVCNCDRQTWNLAEFIGDRSKLHRINDYYMAHFLL